MAVDGREGKQENIDFLGTVWVIGYIKRQCKKRISQILNEFPY
jgi:hypothetical protein